MLKTVIRIVLLVIAFNSLIVDCKSAHDESFREFCLLNQGKFKQAKDEKESDKCVAKFSISTTSQKEADYYCRSWIPYQFVSAERTDKQVSCSFEIRSYCDPGWYNMYDTCYKLIKEPWVEFKTFTKNQAVEECKRMNSNIIKTFRAELPETLSIFFMLTAIWVDFDVTDEKFETKIIDGGTMPAMVFEWSRHYQAPYMSVVKLNGNSDKAMVICEKDSQRSDAFYASNAETYSQLGLNGIVLKNGEIYYPTVSHYARRASLDQYDKICDRFLKPYLSQKIRKQSFLPKIDQLKELTNVSIGQHLIRSGAQRKSLDSRTKDDCVKVDKNGDPLRKEFEIQTGSNVLNMLVNGLKEGFDPKQTCDSQLSTAFKLGDPKVYEASDAFRAPLLCGIEKQIIVSKNTICPNNWKLYQRANGKKICHGFFNDVRMAWDDAQRHCQLFGGGLSGFETEAEYKTFESWRVVWLGAKVKKECEKPGKQPKEDPTCGQKHIFEWQNNVATDTTYLGKSWVDPEPNNVNGYEYCLQFKIGEYWEGAIAGKPKLNDVNCRLRHNFACQYEADIETSIA